MKDSKVVGQVSRDLEAIACRRRLCSESEKGGA